MPIFTFYPEVRFGGDFKTEAAYKEVEVECLILSGGLSDCFEKPEDIVDAIKLDKFENLEFHRGWIIWPLIPYSFDTSVDIPGAAPLPPSKSNILGTDDVKRDVLARVIYGFRISIMFTLLVTIASSLLGILAGAVQGYFGGRTDLFFQRFIEIWGAVPSLYVIIILFAILGRSFWLLVLLTVLFGWMGLVGVVLMPFIVTGTIATLASLDFLGFGLPASAPSLGELTLQAKQNLQAPWLGFTAFFTFAIMLALLVFIFEGIRDAFDPRKTFK